MSVPPGSRNLAAVVANQVDLEFTATRYVGGREHVVFLDNTGKQLGHLFVTPANRSELLAMRQELKKTGRVFAVVHIGAPRYGEPGEYSPVEIINGLHDGEVFCLRTVPGTQTWPEIPEEVLQQWHELWDQ